MTGPTPLVRQFVLCERVTYNSIDHTYTLENPRVDFVAESGESFPAGYPELWLFILFTGSYGRQMFRVRLVDVTDPTVTPVTVFESPDRAIDLGSPTGQFRLRSKSWAVRLNNVLFPHPGRFELWLMSGGLPRAKVDILVEAGP